MQEPLTYRPISTFAILAAGTSLICLLGFMVPFLVVAVIPTLLLGAIALRNVHVYQQKGRRIAWTAIVFALLSVVAFPARHAHDYYSEAPWGYERLSFQKIARDTDELDERVGDKICLKGYFYGRDGTKETSEFGFTPDGNVFNPKVIVHVKLAGGESYQWDGEGVAVSGVLRKSDDEIPTSVLGNSKVYVLEECVIRKPKTHYGLAAPNSGFGC